VSTDESTPRPLRLGVIGTGLAIEKLHWPALRQMPERFEVCAFANHTRPKAEAFAQQAGLDMRNYHADYADLLRRDDVEAVLIALPIPLLYPATRDALQAGKHVICEKPAGADLEQAKEFVTLEDQLNSRKVLLAENFFYRDDLRLARTLIDDGAIGTLHMWSWRVVMQSVPQAGAYTSTPWRQVPEYRGGFFLDAGVHHTAQMRMLCGEVQELQAYVNDANPTMGGPSDMVLNLRFPNSAIGSYIGGSLPIPTPDEPNEMRLYGSTGSLRVSTQHRRLELVRADGSVHAYTPATDGGYVNQLINFYDAILFDEPIVGTIAQSYHNLAIVMRALDSAEAGQPVRMAGLPEEPQANGVPLWRPRGRDPLLEPVH